VPCRLRERKERYVVIRSIPGILAYLVQVVESIYHLLHNSGVLLDELCLIIYSGVGTMDRGWGFHVYLTRVIPSIDFGLFALLL
jgi:hypothetical protein